MNNNYGIKITPTDITVDKFISSISDSTTSAKKERWLVMCHRIFESEYEKIHGKE